MPKLTKKVDRGYRDRYQKQVWRARRENWLAHHPLSAACQARGVVVPATVCDHIKHDPDADWLPFLSAPIQALCAPCHAAKHGRKPRPWTGADGWPLPDGQRPPDDDDDDDDASRLIA